MTLTRGNLVTYEPRRLHAIRRRREFFKAVIVVVTALVVAANIASYALAWMDKDTISVVTAGINLTYGAVLIGYAIKSAADHNSANKYRVQMIEEDGADGMV